MTTTDTPQPPEPPPIDWSKTIDNDALASLDVEQMLEIAAILDKLR